LTKSSIEFSSITFSKEPDAFPPASEISFMSLLRPSSSVLRARYAWYPSLANLLATVPPIPAPAQTTKQTYSIYKSLLNYIASKNRFSNSS